MKKSKLEKILLKEGVSFATNPGEYLKGILSLVWGCEKENDKVLPLEFFTDTVKNIESAFSNCVEDCRNLCTAIRRYKENIGFGYKIDDPIFVELRNRLELNCYRVAHHVIVEMMGMAVVEEERNA